VYCVAYSFAMRAASSALRSDTVNVRMSAFVELETEDSARKPPTVIGSLSFVTTRQAMAGTRASTACVSIPVPVEPPLFGAGTPASALAKSWFERKTLAEAW
jgi:hypothetical protein